MDRARLRAVISRAWNALSTSWLILGNTILLCLVLEGGYRVIRAVAHPGRRAAAIGLHRTDHPYHGQSWYERFPERRDEGSHDQARYDPYRGWKMGPLAYPNLHVDSAGRRITPQPAAKTSHPKQVFLLGASTMWGYSARDSATIPALVARALARRGFSDVVVVNLANSGYNVTQEAITLMLELRRGNVPAVAVALDGLNEAGAVLSGAPVGALQDETLAERRFINRTLLQDLLDHSASLERLLRSTGERRSVASALRTCGDVASYYARMVRQVQDLSRAHGFPTYFLHQPILASSRKVRTSWERWIEQGHPEFDSVTAACGARIDSVMAPNTGRGFYPLHDVFDRDTASVFMDQWGHLTERANGVIAERIVDLIGPSLGRQS